MSAILFDWLGSGGVPVPQEQAEKRSQACLYGDRDKNGKPCKCRFNVAPKWWEKMLKDPIAREIRRQLAVKHEMNLTVPEEDNLGICKPCGCCLPLLVQVDITHIKSHESNFTHYPDFCWKRKEQ